VIPIAFGERLFTLAAEPKRFVQLPQAGHGDVDRYGAMTAVRAFLAEVLP
jgi:hypothetical protein